jgi:hypothetical protein
MPSWPIQAIASYRIIERFATADTLKLAGAACLGAALSATVLVGLPFSDAPAPTAIAADVAAATPETPCERQTWPYIDGKCLNAAGPADAPRQVRVISLDRNAPETLSTAAASGPLETASVAQAAVPAIQEAAVAAPAPPAVAAEPPPALPQLAAVQAVQADEPGPPESMPAAAEPAKIAPAELSSKVRKAAAPAPAAAKRTKTARRSRTLDEAPAQSGTTVVRVYELPDGRRVTVYRDFRAPDARRALAYDDEPRPRHILVGSGETDAEPFATVVRERLSDD